MIELKKIFKYSRPKIAIILGSGLGSLADEIKNPTIIPYSKIKDFPQINVAGHQGRLIVGELEGKLVLCMQGRIHLYEGHPPQSVDKIIKSFQKFGIRSLIVTTAAGSTTEDIPAGSIMLINDHINFSGYNPLIGPNDESIGPRFPDMSDPYHEPYRLIAKKIAKSKKIKLYEGVHLMVSGPTFETAAENKAFRILGADSVSMSTVTEVISAVHCGMKVLGFSIITNLGTGIQTSPSSHEETVYQGQKAAGNLSILIRNIIKEL